MRPERRRRSGRSATNEKPPRGYAQGFSDGKPGGWGAEGKLPVRSVNVGRWPKVPSDRRNSTLYRYSDRSQPVDSTGRLGIRWSVARDGLAHTSLGFVLDLDRAYSGSGLIFCEQHVPDIEPLTAPPPVPFACPACEAHYILVRADADGASASGHVMCRRCGGSLSGREGRFVLKYLRL
jgi:hypothetical protein